jgi:hypothetical protein
MTKPFSANAPPPGVGLKENEAKRSSPWLWPKAWVSLQG